MKCPNCECEVNEDLLATLTGSRITTVCDTPVVACLACGTVYALIDEGEEENE